MHVGSIERYFLMVLLLSVPFWVLGGITAYEALPGIPASAVMVIVPAVVAVGLIVRNDGVEEALHWIKTTLSPSVVHRPQWVLLSLLLPPATLALAYGLMRLDKVPFPASDPGVVDFALLVGFFFVPALLEELGWTGFALEKLQRRISAFGASFLIGAIWALWHFVPLLQIGRSLPWIAWWAVASIAIRVLIAWVYNNSGGSVLLSGLFHASVNASWQSFPVRGSHYDPAAHAIVLIVTTAVVVTVFGPGTLSGARSKPSATQRHFDNS